MVYNTAFVSGDSQGAHNDAYPASANSKPAASEYTLPVNGKAVPGYEIAGYDSPALFTLPLHTVLVPPRWRSTRSQHTPPLISTMKDALQTSGVKPLAITPTGSGT